MNYLGFSYLEMLATVYVISNFGFILSAIKRDVFLIENKTQLDSVYKSLNEYKDAYKALLNKHYILDAELLKLRNFYNSHNANKEAEVIK